MQTRHLPFSLLSFLAAACAATSSLGPDGAVPYPEDYREWTHVKSMLIEQGHPLYESFGGIHHIYANDLALEGLRGGDGRFEDGAVFAFDLLAAEEDGNAVTEGPRKVLGVMHKSADAFADTGGWGFAGFAGDTRDNVVTDPRSSCFECHTSQRESGYVFSRWRE